MICLHAPTFTVEFCIAIIKGSLKISCQEASHQLLGNETARWGLSPHIIEVLSPPIHVTGHASPYFPVSWVLTIWGCKGWCPGNLPIRKIQDRTTLPVLVQNPPMASVSYFPVLTKESMKMKNASCSHVDHFPLPAKLCLSSPSTMPRPSHTLVISFWHSLAQNILMFSNSCICICIWQQL